MIFEHPFAEHDDLFVDVAMREGEGSAGASSVSWMSTWSPVWVTPSKTSRVAWSPLLLTGRSSNL